MYDVVIVGGGPCGATSAHDLALKGYRVALLDRAGRIKPCGGAIPPRLITDFDIPDRLLVAKITTARMLSPSQRHVDIPIENGFVGMVDREDFDEFLRARAQLAGVQRFTGTYKRIERPTSSQGACTQVIYYDPITKTEHILETKFVIGADGARSVVARQEIKDGDKIPYVIAYHEIVDAPSEHASYHPDRCDVIYDGAISPDFYGWIFPHGSKASIGMGTGLTDVDLKAATSELRRRHNLETCPTIRQEGAPIPLKPLKQWDNQNDVIVAGDAAGVVAPSSGEGIYYAMACGRVVAQSVSDALQAGSAKPLSRARKVFMREHGPVFRVLGAMQNAYYKSDDRRERFVSLCHDVDVQKLTFESYMNKKLVNKRPWAHLKIAVKNLAHPTGLISARST